MSDESNLGTIAKGLARNPLGIVALFVVLVYALASLLFGLSIGLNPIERLIFLTFLVAFPLIIFCAFLWVVVRHHDKLYAPGDFSNEEHFVELSKKVDAKVSHEIDKRISELEDKHEYEICYLRLTSAKSQGRFDIAIEWAEKYLLKHRDSEMLTQKAYCFWEIAKREDALACINEAIDVSNFRKPENKATAFYNRACYRSTLEKDDELIEKDLREAIKLDSKYLAMMKEESDLTNFDTLALARCYE